MAQSTASRTGAVSRQIQSVPLPVKASNKIYQYTEVCVDANGFAVMASDTSGLIHLGYSISPDVDNSAGSSGDKSVNVVLNPLDRYREFDCSSATQAWVGDLVSFVDDHTVGLQAAQTNDICAGRVVQYLSATKVLVDTVDKFNPPAAA